MVEIYEYEEIFNHIESDVEILLWRNVDSKLKLLHHINGVPNAIDYNIKFNTFKNSTLSN